MRQPPHGLVRHKGGTRATRHRAGHAPRAMGRDTRIQFEHWQSGSRQHRSCAHHRGVPLRIRLEACRRHGREVTRTCWRGDVLRSMRRHSGAPLASRMDAELEMPGTPHHTWWGTRGRACPTSSPQQGTCVAHLVALHLGHPSTATFPPPSLHLVALHLALEVCRHEVLE